MTENLNSKTRFAVIVACALAAGCTGTNTNVALLDPGKPLDPPAAAPPSIAPGVVGSAPHTPPAPIQSATKPDAKVAVTSTPPVAKPAPAPKEAAVKVEPAARAQKAGTPATPSSAPKPAAPAGSEAKTAAVKTESPPPVARKAESTLDVGDLKARLGETKAIGVFTKLALKNQMDDLLDRFRAVYQSGQKSGVSALRQPYDALVVKVLTQLRPGDPSLARSIESSREAIWGILADPEKFKSVT